MMYAQFENERTGLNPRRFWTDFYFSKDLLAGATTMNLQCARLCLAMVSSRPTPLARVLVARAVHDKPPHDKSSRAANDNHPVWPLIPFPAGWYASG